MPSAPRVTAIIPARGGSKGIPRKNLREVAGHPLLAWTIQAALDCAAVTRCVVSSEDDEVLEVARAYGAETLRRPAALATDEAPSEPVVGHALEELARRGEPPPDVVVLLQPTSPLRTGAHLAAALARLRDTGADAVISVVEPTHSPFKCFVLRPDGTLAGLVSDDAPFRRRQDLPRALRPNGAIYAVTTESFVRTGKLLGPRTVAHEMDRAASLDIDEPGDLALATAALAGRPAPRRVGQKG